MNSTETAKFAPHQQRVVVEKVELDEKLTKLQAFVKTEKFAGLSVTERALLLDQEVAMKTYSAILRERIARFEPSEA